MGTALETAAHLRTRRWPRECPASSGLSPVMLAVSFLPAPGCFLLLPGPESDLDPPVSPANWYSSSKSQPESLLPLLQRAGPLLPTRAGEAALPHPTALCTPTPRLEHSVNELAPTPRRL